MSQKISLEKIASPFNYQQKEVWIGWVSSLVEAYNMAIYSFMAPLLAILLFKQATVDQAVFLSYTFLFLGSCFFYPLGAIYYGFLGDERGRKRTCVYSTLGLAIATGLMGLVPLNFLGDKAWICFLLLICAQYFFSGGEYHGSIIFSLEHSEEKQTGLMSSLSCLFAVLGLVMANGLATFSSLLNDAFWIRICFLIGAGGGLISYFLKNHCQETPAFSALHQDSFKKVDWSIFFKSHWKTIATVAVVLAFYIVSYSFIFIFLPLGYLDVMSGQSFDTFRSLIAYGVFLIIAGWLADRIGIQKVMLMGVFLFSASIIPLCYFCKNLLTLQILLTFSACLVIGPIHGWMLHQFAVRERCRGIFISSAIATSLCGGSTVSICLTILERSHSLVLCGMYPLALALSAFCLLYTESYSKMRFPAMPKSRD